MAQASLLVDSLASLEQLVLATVVAIIGSDEAERAVEMLGVVPADEGGYPDLSVVDGLERV